MANKQKRRFPILVIFSFWLALIPIFSQGALAQPTDSPFKKVRLKNGLTVLYRVMNDYPMVSMYAVFPVGMNQEKEKGIAHLMEHLVFRGGSGFNFRDIADVTVRKGGEFNGFTSFEGTAYTYTVPKESLNQALQIFNGSIWNTGFSDDVVNLERKIVIHELDMDYTSRLEYYPVFHYFYPETSYSKATVAAITHQDLMDFHRSFYQPENATYILAGDFDPQPILDQLEKITNGNGHQPVLKPEIKEFDLPAGEVEETRNLYPYQFQLLMTYQFQDLGIKEKLILKLLSYIYGYDAKIDYERNEYQIYNVITRSVGHKDYFGIFYLERNRPYSEDAVREQKAKMLKYFREFRKTDFKNQLKNLTDEVELEIAASRESPEDAASYETQRLVDHDALTVDALPLLKKLTPKDLEQFINRYFNQPPRSWILIKTTPAGGLK